MSATNTTKNMEVSDNMDLDPVIALSDRQPTLQNVVATADLGLTLDLKVISRSAKNTEFKPKRFAAVIMRLTDPRATILIFETGKIVCTGAKNEATAYVATKRCASIIKHINSVNIKVRDFKIQNMVANCSVGFPIRLEALQDEHLHFARYEPEIFPGLIYRMVTPKVVLLIFVSGRIIFTGAKSQEDIMSAWNQIYNVLLRFKKM
ncbi:uncharacterized protein LOC126324504 [Schistocerca gregaria]|uniref:uncharacterized protein LOC126324504 n=1 Tax=Schistocerca gregaria TaxID=7010 RepID=UPI00211E7AF6|nr:uncharacterized protein LOC126324504 [Schistocerca gregaria]XP_049850963.1 uncharacterized protein LOC126324504 [Schistocerca gregaria]XP_049850964.1 uncharacterized protein LOC126324504 [Schistocerca gregaria]